MESRRVREMVESHIDDYASSQLAAIFAAAETPPFAVKYLDAQWAGHYAIKAPLKISETPAQTWGTGTYVTPLAYPLSSVLYGRIGVVSPFDPADWQIFDATGSAGQNAYMAWARAQPLYRDLVLTVHSSLANHQLRNAFRRQFGIDCVLFHPDQEAQLHTNRTSHVWMLVTDWVGGEIDATFSARLAEARFTVLVDEEFGLMDASGLPVQLSAQRIEPTTAAFNNNLCIPVSQARNDPALPSEIIRRYWNDGYVHVYIEP